MRVDVKGDGALESFLDVTSAAPQLQELSDPADDEREKHLGYDFAMDGAAETK